MIDRYKFIRIIDEFEGFYLYQKIEQSAFFLLRSSVILAVFMLIKFETLDLLGSASGDACV
jgi:hypothetical protein